MTSAKKTNLDKESKVCTLTTCRHIINCTSMSVAAALPKKVNFRSEDICITLESVTNLTIESITWATGCQLERHQDSIVTPAQTHIHTQTHTGKYDTLPPNDTKQSENIMHIYINGICNKRAELIQYLNEHNQQLGTINKSKICKQHKSTKVSYN